MFGCSLGYFLSLFGVIGRHGGSYHWPILLLSPFVLSFASRLFSLLACVFSNPIFLGLLAVGFVLLVVWGRLSLPYFFVDASKFLMELVDLSFSPIFGGYLLVGIMCWCN